MTANSSDTIPDRGVGQTKRSLLRANLPPRVPKCAGLFIVQRTNKEKLESEAHVFVVRYSRIILHRIDFSRTLKPTGRVLGIHVILITLLAPDKLTAERGRFLTAQAGYERVKRAAPPVTLTRLSFPPPTSHFHHHHPAIARQFSSRHSSPACRRLIPKNDSSLFCAARPDRHFLCFHRPSIFLDFLSLVLTNLSTLTNRTA